jgi:serine/threonine protein kinase
MSNTLGDYSLEKTLGKGSFGLVKLAHHRTTKELVAIKLLSKKYIVDVEKLDRILSEMQLLKGLRHANIVMLLDVVDNETHLSLVMEYVQGGSLFEFVRQQGKLDVETTRKIFRQILAGVEYCHKHHIVHRDLKPENILLTDTGQVKIADFGACRSFDNETDLMRTRCGTMIYGAPEVWHKPYVGTLADIWSLGVILYVLLSGRVPFIGENEEVSAKIVYQRANAHNWKYPKSIPVSARSLIHQCLSPAPSERPSLVEIYQHAFIDPYSFNYGSGSDGEISGSDEELAGGRRMSVPHLDGEAELTQAGEAEGEEEEEACAGSLLLEVPEIPRADLGNALGDSEDEDEILKLTVKHSITTESDMTDDDRDSAPMSTPPMSGVGRPTHGSPSSGSTSPFELAPDSSTHSHGPHSTTSTTSTASTFGGGHRRPVTSHSHSPSASTKGRAHSMRQMALQNVHGSEGAASHAPHDKVRKSGSLDTLITTQKEGGSLRTAGTLEVGKRAGSTTAALETASAVGGGSNRNSPTLQFRTRSLTGRASHDTTHSTGWTLSPPAVESAPGSWKGDSAATSASSRHDSHAISSRTTLKVRSTGRSLSMKSQKSSSNMSPRLLPSTSGPNTSVASFRPASEVLEETIRVLKLLDLQMEQVDAWVVHCISRDKIEFDAEVFEVKKLKSVFVVKLSPTMGDSKAFRHVRDKVIDELLL